MKTLCFLTMFIGCVATAEVDTSKWYFKNSDHYDIVLDSKMVVAGNASLKISGINPHCLDKKLVIAQTISALHLRDKCLKGSFSVLDNRSTGLFQHNIKVYEGVSGNIIYNSGRSDPPDGTDRSTKEQWTSKEWYCWVSGDSTEVVLEFIIQGEGDLWLDNIKMDIVEYDSVPEKERKWKTLEGVTSTRFKNLGFGDGSDLKR